MLEQDFTGVRMSEVLSDMASERAVLGGISRYGANSYFDVADILDESSFQDKTNSILYKVFKTIIEREGKIDIPSILSVSKELNLDHILSKKQEVAHLDAILHTQIEPENVRKFAAKVKKLQVARLLIDQLDKAKNKLYETTGNESITSILGVAENAVMEFGSLINDTDNNPKNIGETVEDYVEYLLSNPVDSVGIPTCLPTWDKAIGGGLRKRTVSVIGARPKQGKSTISINTALKVGQTIPVLVLDNEMSEEDQKCRMLAALSGLKIESIEKGKLNEYEQEKLREAARRLKNYDGKIFFKSISGLPLEEQLSVARRWILKEVGLNDDGTAKDCLIIYDQMQITDEKDLKNIAEYQAVGFIILNLHDFAFKYGLPILAFIQLNRDGVEKESSTVVAQSDRIIWRCSNFSIFKPKSDEEIAQDGPENGNRKLIPIVCRHGPGLNYGEYINLNMKGWCSKIIEGKTNFELKQGIKNTDEFASDGQNEF